MPSFLEVAKTLKDKIADPRNCLQNRPLLNNKMMFLRDDVIFVSKMSKYVYIVYSPHPVYVSTVFNRNFSFTENDFRLVVAKRCLDSVYYDLEVQAL